MFKHEKELFHPVGIERPNPQYAALLQEQLGGKNVFFYVRSRSQCLCGQGCIRTQVFKLKASGDPFFRIAANCTLES